ncbi:MAG TPA: MFS transporter [Steroidobacteraceae bacterium]|nr:MFS transporter [Steroidobacteraceae bacterium]
MNNSASSRKWYPWFVAFVGLAVLFISNGYTATALSVFDESLLNEFGWDRGPFKFRDLLTFAITAVVAPFVGIVIDRVNLKWLLITGMVLLSAGYFGYSQLTADGSGGLATPLALVALAGLAVMATIVWREAQGYFARTAALVVIAATMAAVVYYRFIDPMALHQVYIIHVVFSLALSTAGTMVVVVLVTSWFLKSRGLAIGIALLGTSLGGIVLSRANIEIIQSTSWREAFGYLALVPLLFAVLIFFFLRGSPKDAGVVAIGQEAGARDLKSYGLTFAEAIRTPTFWVIGISGFLTYYSILALFNHMFLHMRGLGFEPAQAANALALLGTLAAISKLAIGWLADHIDRKLVFLGALAVMFVGVLLIAMGGREWVWIGIGITGCGWGGLFTLYNMLTVNNFGLKEIGRINGTVSLLESLGGGLGIWLTGKLYDVFGSYEVPFDVIAAAVLLGFAIGLFIKSGSPEAMGLQPAAVGRIKAGSLR